MDQSGPNHQQKVAPQNAVPVGAFRQSSVPTLERGITSGDNVQFGRPWQRTCLPKSESQSSGAEEERLSSSMEASNPYGKSPVLQSMHAEGVWYNRSAYEQAESNYQRWFASDGSPLLSISPRSPNTRGSLTFHSRATRNEQQDQGYPVSTVKSSGTRHPQYSRNRNRTTSETDQRAKGSRGLAQRKRGLSETESRPRWDKYDTSHTENGADVCIQCLTIIFLFVWLHFCLAFVYCANLCICNIFHMQGHRNWIFFSFLFRLRKSTLIPFK